GTQLYQREVLGRDVWSRGMTEDFTQKVDEEILVEEDNALYALIRSYRFALKNVKKAVHHVTQSLQSIAEKIWEMRERLVVGRSTRYSELIGTGPDPRGQILITFLSLLELAKMGMVSLFQTEH